MGYSHAWRDRGAALEIAPEALAIIRELLTTAHEAGRIQREYDDPAPPIVERDRIVFNGRGPLGYETFHYTCGAARRDLLLQSGGAWGYLDAFCKTNRNAYDGIVQRVLLTLAYFSPSMLVQSDGDPRGDDWREAREWAERQGFEGLIYHERTIIGPLKAAAIDRYRAAERERLAEPN